MFLTTKPGCGVGDTGAGALVIGRETLKEHNKISSGNVIEGGHSPNGFFGEMDSEPQGVDTVSWDINIGDVVAHDLNTVHMGGFGRTNTALRRAVALRYLGDDITFNESLPGIPNIPDLLDRYRVRWPDLQLVDGQKYDPQAFPQVK